MPDVQSALRGAVVETAPFKHCVTANCLDKELYEELARSFPVVPVSKYSNTATFRRGSELISKTQGHWRAFLEYHLSKAFFNEVRDLFGLNLSGSVGVRGRDFGSAIRLECQCVVNSPVTTPSVVKGPHYDNPETRWAGILYFADPDDDAGGDLCLYDVPSPHFYKKRYTDNHGEPFRVVKYQPNHFVAWENSPIAIHGVTARQPTQRIRRYVNFTIDS